VPWLLRCTSVRPRRSAARTIVGELLIGMPSTGRPWTSAEITAPSRRAASALASPTSPTSRHSVAPPASA
jgi:hypothetical protein